MPDQSSVLIFGYDGYLLRTRRWVLENQNDRVWTAMDLMTVGQILSTERIDVLILCQTLSVEDCEDAMALTRATQPTAGVLVMDPDETKHIFEERATVIAQIPNPRMLITAIQKVSKQSKDCAFADM